VPFVPHGQGCWLHCFTSMFGPGHSFPPFVGGGIEHCLTATVIPPPHSRLQSEYGPYLVQLPSIKRNRLKQCMGSERGSFYLGRKVLRLNKTAFVTKGHCRQLLYVTVEGSCSSVAFVVGRSPRRSRNTASSQTSHCIVRLHTNRPSFMSLGPHTNQSKTTVPHGHRCLLQSLKIVLLPLQVLPPSLGLGLLHSRSLF
jgi:hypothetical protein